MAELISSHNAPIEMSGTSGEAVVLLHGFTGHAGHWIPIADRLSDEGHTVVAPLLPGHGTSPADLATTRWRDWLDAARDSARSVSDHRRVHLVGLSMGGLLAILVARATAAATVTTINSPVLVRDFRVMFAPLAHRFLPETPATDLDPPDPALAHLWTPYPTIPTAAVAELLGVVWTAYRRAGDLRRPSLVIQSRTDEAVLPISGWLLARRLGVRPMWLDSSRHNAALDPAREHVAKALSALITA